MNRIRWALSWTLYWLGDLVSYPMNWPLGYHLYPIYNVLMGWSVDIQGESDNGPWREVEDNHVD